MARRQRACGLVLVGLLPGRGGGSRDDSSGEREAAPASTQPADEATPAKGE